MSRHTHPSLRSPQPGYASPATFPSPRSLYPQFLSFRETAYIELTCAGQGLLDAFRLDIVARLVVTDAEVRANVLKSLLLNTLSLASVYFFDFLLHPLAQSQQKWLHRNVGWFYQILWLLPIVGVSLYLNGTWCTVIAKRTFVLRHGARAVAQQPTTYTGILNSMASSAYRVIMVFTSIIVSFALGYIPAIGPFIGFAFLCWVDSYYCFEFIWIARGLSLSRRVRHLEERWAYYFAFGLPTAALCMWGSSLANAALFALVFPAYIIMAMHARPVPLDPYNPSASTSAGSEIHHPSPFIPIKLPIFAVVIWLNDWIVRILSLGAGPGGGSIERHRRVVSDASENLENGSAVELGPVSSPNTGRTRVRRGAAPSLGSRKRD